ncbi:hypothetical protein [Amycolatopsis azurea]|uniref:Hsp18 transcriptional regulator n=1 Tax=Amycolatopsis azurea DSM 43854 TaxID=1238180 RepID=M2PUJ8_9PSEU|nr:hypothetical protein [Amycolatopsis azurea]EMD28298.1 hsp18 transcriptional regulator [Amycolatopsis azurea DSM 43854]OOC00817.1 HSP18 transcriptional regulator [Amycolatopsis azurea DSM 43854]
METDLAHRVRAVHDVVAAARSGTADPEVVLVALATLRAAREEMSAWEPELIAAARSGGASWTALAPALGVASRQAAERRFLRLRPSVTGEDTGEARVEAERDRRAGDRAVADWARRNSAILRQLAGQAGGLNGLTAEGRESADKLGTALGENDATTLLAPLADFRTHLTGKHADFAERLGEVGDHAGQVRREAMDSRRRRDTQR